MLKLNNRLIGPYAQLFAVELYCIASFSALPLNRSGLVYFLLILFGGGLDLLYKTCFRKSPIVIPVSGLQAASSVFLLSRSNEVFWYFLVTAFAISSKYIFHYKKKHFFNPSNFSILVFICLFPNAVWLNIDFIPYNWLAALILVLGILVTLFNKKGVLISSYIISFSALTFIFGKFFALWPFNETYTHLYYLFWPSRLLDIFSLIFIFHMLPDPATTPTALRGQLLFGCSFAVVDVLLRSQSVLPSQLAALSILTLAYSFLKNYPLILSRTNNVGGN